jgi:hypothetical protein
METSWDLSRKAAAIGLLVLVASGLALRLWEYRAFLPQVFYSDYIQITQATDLLRDGSFMERSSYPVTHTYVYAAADVVAYSWDRILGGPDWATFIENLTVRDQGLRHVIGRVYTAIMGSLLALAVYRLARVRHARKVALLAAAFAAFSPAHVIYGHQPRIHVPGILALTLAAIPVVQCLDSSTGWRRAAAAGAACAGVAAIFQFGFFLFVTALGLVGFGALLRRRTWRRAVTLGLILGIAFGATLGILHLVTHPPGVVRPAPGSGTFDNVGTLGIPTVAVEGVSVERFLQRFPLFFVHWCGAEPFVALGVVVYLARAIRRRAPWSELIALGLYPLLVFLVLGTTYTEVRYSLSALPFLGILAAEALVRARPMWLRAILVAASVLVPLASSIRYDILIGADDTRLALHRMLPNLESDVVRTSIDTPLLLPPFQFHPGIVQFPPNGNYSVFAGPKASGLPAALFQQKAQVFVAVDDPEQTLTVAPKELQTMGFQPYAKIRGGIRSRTFLPDAPEWLLVDLWNDVRCGPTILIWVKSPAARRHLDKWLPRELVEPCD